MARLTGPTAITQQDTMTSTSEKMHDLGQLGVTSDGRKYRYCKAVATLVTGDC